ncbi:MAG: hypothetical protein HC817_06710 [Saprospiraceae bacterium]|nr:hypothetical protein [Saprospiraceae bacterium]
MVFSPNANLKLIICLCLGVSFSSCFTKKIILQSALRQGQPFDIQLDTIYKIYYNINKKIVEEKYTLNDKVICVKEYNFYKHDGWEMLNCENILTRYYPSGKVYLVVPVKQLTLSEYQPDLKSIINGVKDTRFRNFKQKVFHGILKEYYENGKLRSIKEYRDGLLWNIFEMYFSDGEPLDFGDFKNGSGTIKIYNRFKILTYIITYQNGEIIKREFVPPPIINK